MLSLKSRLLICATVLALLGGIGIPGPTAAYAADGTVQASLALPTGDPFTSLLLLKVSAPSKVNLNSNFDYMLEASNLSSSVSLEDVHVTMRPDATFRLASTNPTADKNASGALSWNLGTLVPKESKQISVNGSASSIGNVVSCLYATYNPFICLPINVIEPQLSLTKSAPADVLICDPIPMTLVVSNPGNGPTTNVTIVDNLPAGLTTSDGKSSVTLDVGTLNSGESRQYTIDVRASRTGTFVNNATASADGGLTAAAKTTTKVHEPVLAITKVATREWQYLNRDVTFNMTLTNKGDWVADDTVMEDFVPSGTDFVSASGGGTYSDETHKVSWSVGSLQPGETRDFSITVTARQFGILRNTTTAQAFCAKPVSAAAQVEVRGVPAVLLEVIDLNDPNQLGDVEEYVITVTNQGSMDANDVTIVATVQPEGEYVSSSGASEARVSGKVVSFTPVPTLRPKARIEWRVKVRATGEGDTRFRVKMTTKRLTSPVEESESTKFYQ